MGVGRAELGHDQWSGSRSPLQVPEGGSLQDRAVQPSTGGEAEDDGPAGAGPERHGCSAWPRAQLGATSSTGRRPGPTAAPDPFSRNGRLAMPFLVMWQAEVPPPNLAMLRRRSRPQGARVRVLGVASGAGPSHGDGGPAPGPSTIGPGPGSPTVRRGG